MIWALAYIWVCVAGAFFSFDVYANGSKSLPMQVPGALQEIRRRANSLALAVAGGLLLVTGFVVGTYFLFHLLFWLVSWI